MDRLRAEYEQLKIQASNASNLVALVREYQNYESNLRSILYADNKTYAVSYYTDGSVQILYY